MEGAMSRFDPAEGRIRFLSLDDKNRPDVVLGKYAGLNAQDW